MKKRDIIIKSNYALIPLTQNKLTIIDLEDVERVSRYNWHIQKCKKQVYAATIDYDINSKTKLILLHRFILNPPPKKQIDHINRNTLDNRRNNLRICTNRQNCRNKPKANKTSSSKYKGVWHNKRNNKWYAIISMDKRKVKQKSHLTEIEAAKTYDRLALKLFGEFAYLNFPE